MPKRIRTLGYPSRTAAVAALIESGRKPGEIATLIGCTLLEVYNARKFHRSLGEPIPDKTVLFGGDIFQRGERFAMARGITVNELFRRIVETAIEENIVDAVLDDREAPQ